MEFVPSRPEKPTSLEPNSVSLLYRYQDGDRDALNELLTRYRPRLERIVFARLGPRLRARVEVDDVLQASLIRIMDGLGTFEVREDAGMIQYMAKIIENEIIRLARYHGAEKRNAEKETPIERFRAAGEDSNFSLELIADSSGPQSKVERLEMEKIMDQCLSDLPEDYREVILLRDYAGGSWEFVAEQLKSPSPDAAKHMYQRAKAKLVVAVERNV